MRVNGHRTFWKTRPVPFLQASLLGNPEAAFGTISGLGQSIEVAREYKDAE